MSVCIDHLNFCGEVCPDCGLEVDDYGNTEAVFAYCCFPDCGCDGARLCMAPGGASDRAARQNVEGMWSRKGTERVSKIDRRTVGQVRMELLSGLYGEDKAK